MKGPRLLILLVALIGTLSFANASKDNSTNTLMKMVFSSLVGAQKFKEALQVAQKGTLLFPKDPYWWENYAQLLIWTNQPEKALEPMLKAYELTGSKEIAQRLFSLAVAFKDYRLAERLIPVVNPNYKDSVYIYMQTGNVEALITYLKNENSLEAKELLAELFFTLGRLDEALSVIDDAVKTFGADENLVLLKAQILYAKREHNKALQVLKENAKKSIDNAEFWETLSDLAWMLGDYETAYKASKRLVESDRGRAEDYQRMVEFLAEKDPQEAIRLAQEGYAKFRVLFFVELLFYIAYKNQLWDSILSLAEERDIKNLILSRDYLLSYYASALIAKGEKDKAFKLIEERLAQSISSELLSFYIYTLLEEEQVGRLIKAITNYRNYALQAPNAFISAYIKLQRGKEAYALYRRAGLKNEVLLADILSALGKEDEAKQLRWRAFQKRREELKKNPSLAQDESFINEYLYLASEFMSEQAFELYLLSVKNLLPEKTWRRFYLAHLLSRERHDRALRLVKFLGYKEEAWMAMSRYLYYDERAEIKDLLERAGDLIPRRDRVEALRRVYAYKEALTVAFEKLEQAPYDYRLYKQLRDLAVDHGNRLEISNTYQSRKGYAELGQTYRITLREVRKGVSVGVEGSYFLLAYKRANTLKKAPKGYSAGIHLSRNTEKDHLGVRFGVRERLEAVPYLELSWTTYRIKRSAFEIKVGKNAESDETLYLYLGGVKDYLRISFSHNLTNRTTLAFQAEKSYYKDTDGTKLGEGNSYYAGLSHYLFYAYPDIQLRFYGQVFNSSSTGSLGKLQKIAPNGAVIIPQSYSLLGAGISVGYFDKERYRRPLRPFLSLDIGLNSRFGAFFSLRGGAGATVWDKDKLLFEAGLSTNAGATKETQLFINSHYIRLF